MKYPGRCAADMSEKRILALLGFLLGLVAAVLILVRGLDFGRNPQFDVDFVLRHIVALLIAVAILLGSVLVYRAKSSTGGLVNLLLGVVGIFIAGVGTDAAVLAIVSGVLGILAAETFR